MPALSECFQLINVQEALEVLRTTSNQVELKICRPPPDVLSCVSPISEVPPPPPRRDLPSTLSLPSVSDDEHCHGVGLSAPPRCLI